MKFSTKLTCAVTVLIALAFSLGGYLLVRQNFQDALAQAVSQNSSQHLLERYALENNLTGLLARGEEASDERLSSYAASLAGYLGEGGRLFAFYTDEQRPIFTNLPPDISEGDVLTALETGGEYYHLRRAGAETYMLLSSHISQPNRSLWLLNAYPVTSLFSDRERQLQNLLRLELIIVAVVTVIVAAMCRGLTRPIRRLNLVSRKMAAGAYSARTNAQGADEIGELGQNFDKMAEAVEDKVRALNASVHQRDDFVSAFTHEIKTPMTSIIGYSDILRSMECEPAQRQKAANYIYHESKRLEALSQKLLVLMGISEERLVLRPVMLNTMLGEIARSVTPLLGNVRLEIRSAAEIQVRADRELAGDMLRNLILNAVKAEPKDGKVRINWAVEGQRVWITVLDTGRGIPPDELARITEPFYMVDKSRARAAGGTGIGLALCEKIAALHGGTLQFHSVVDEGTAVSFDLPLWTEASV